MIGWIGASIKLVFIISVAASFSMHKIAVVGWFDRWQVTLWIYIAKMGLMWKAPHGWLIVVNIKGLSHLTSCDITDIMLEFHENQSFSHLSLRDLEQCLLQNNLYSVTSFAYCFCLYRVHYEDFSAWLYHWISGFAIIWARTNHHDIWTIPHDWYITRSRFSNQFWWDSIVYPLMNISKS